MARVLPEIMEHISNTSFKRKLKLYTAVICLGIHTPISGVIQERVRMPGVNAGGCSECQINT